MSTVSRQLDTADLTRVTARAAVIGWIGTVVLGAGLHSVVSLDIVVLGVSLFWLVLTAGTVAYVRPGTPSALGRNVVWQYWLVASVLGVVVNIAAALIVTTGTASGEPIKETAPMELGVIVPWLLIYAGGYLLPAGYERDSAALNSAERGIYAVAGVVSLLLAGVLVAVPSTHHVMILALTALSLVPLLTLRYRR